MHSHLQTRRSLITRGRLIDLELVVLIPGKDLVEDDVSGQGCLVVFVDDVIQLLEVRDVAAIHADNVNRVQIQRRALALRDRSSAYRRVCVCVCVCVIMPVACAETRFNRAWGIHGACIREILRRR